MNDIDPRAKIIWSLVWLIIIFIVYNIIGQLIVLLGIIVIIKLNRVSLRSVLKAVRYLLIFLPVTFLVHFFFSSRGWDFIIGKTHYISNMINQPVMFTLRMGNLILLMSFLLKWIGDIEFLDAIYHTLKPLRRLKLSVDDFFQIIFIAVRFFPILKEEYIRLDEGWKSFVKVKNSKLSERINRARDSVIPLMIFSFQRAETLADAMVIRGYGSQIERSYYQPLRFGYKDWLATAAAMVLLISTIIWMP